MSRRDSDFSSDVSLSDCDDWDQAIETQAKRSGKTNHDVDEAAWEDLDERGLQDVASSRLKVAVSGNAVTNDSRSDSDHSVVVAAGLRGSSVRSHADLYKDAVQYGMVTIRPTSSTAGSILPHRVPTVSLGAQSGQSSVVPLFPARGISTGDPNIASTIRTNLPVKRLNANISTAGSKSLSSGDPPSNDGQHSRAQLHSPVAAPIMHALHIARALPSAADPMMAGPDLDVTVDMSRQSKDMPRSDRPASATASALSTLALDASGSRVNPPAQDSDFKSAPPAVTVDPVVVNANIYCEQVLVDQSHGPQLATSSSSVDRVEIQALQSSPSSLNVKDGVSLDQEWHAAGGRHGVAMVIPNDSVFREDSPEERRQKLDELRARKAKLEDLRARRIAAMQSSRDTGVTVVSSLEWAALRRKSLVSDGGASDRPAADMGDVKANASVHYSSATMPSNIRVRSSGNGVESVRGSSRSNRASLRDNPFFAREFSKFSNLELIRLAIRHTLLAGAINEKERNAALEALQPFDDGNFVAVVKNYDGIIKLRGMLRLQNENDEFVGIRIHGKCPERVDASMVKNFYKFDSGSRRFAVLRAGCDDMTTADGIEILGVHAAHCFNGRLAQDPYVNCAFLFNGAPQPQPGFGQFTAKSQLLELSL